MPYNHSNGELVWASQLSNSVLDAGDPSPLHIPSVEYNPVSRTALVPAVNCRSTVCLAHLSDWIILHADGDFSVVPHSEFVRNYK